MMITPRSLENDQGSAEARHAAARAGLNVVPADDLSRLADLAVRLASAGLPPPSGEPGSPPAPGLAVGALRVTFGGPHGARLEADGTPLAATLPHEADSEAPDGRRELPTVDVRAEAEAAVWNAIAEGASVVRIDSGPAAGTTTFLRALAARAREHGFVDGALWATDARGPAADVAQLLAASLDPARPPRYRTASEVAAVAGDRRMLVLLRRARLTEADVAELVQTFPGFGFVVDNALSLRETATVVLGALDPVDALMLLEASWGRRLDPDDRGTALGLCAFVGSLPESIRLVGIAARTLRRSFASLAQQSRAGDDIVRALIASRPPLDARILGLLALARAPLAAHHIAYILRDDAILRSGAIDTSLSNLTSCELIRTGESGTYDVSRYVEGLVPLLADADAVRARIVAVLSDVIESSPARPVLDRQLSAAQTHLEEMSQHSEWLQVLALGPQLAQTFAIRGAFGAWGRALREVEAAAARAGDAHAYALARHELGVRAVLRGNLAEAEAYLRAAVADRRALGDAAGAAASSAVLALVDSGNSDPAVAASFTEPSPPAAPDERIGWPPIDVRSLKLAGIRLPRLPLTAAAAAAFEALQPRLSEIRLPTGRRMAFTLMGLWLGIFTLIAFAVASHSRHAPVIAGLSANPAAPVERASITTFFANPPRIRAGGSTQLCYAVTGAHHVQILPHIGPLMRLRGCRTITLRAPQRYDYQLTARGDNGSVAIRHLRIDVTAAANPVPVSRFVGKPAALRAIREFRAEPHAITRGRSASICVAVDHASSAFLTAVGKLPIGAVRCYRVRPQTTTVYRLTVTARQSVAVAKLTVEVWAARSPHAVVHQGRH